MHASDGLESVCGIGCLPQRIVTGGQTGVDRAALDWAIHHGIDHGGWCPAGRRAEDGQIPMQYHLEEMPGAGYRQRTRQNVIDSDATLILNAGALDGGTEQTRVFALRAMKPCLVVRLEEADIDGAAQEIVAWLKSHCPRVLNVAGPREGKRPGIAALARRTLDRCTRFA